MRRETPSSVANESPLLPFSPSRFPSFPYSRAGHKLGIEKAIWSGDRFFAGGLPVYDRDALIALIRDKALKFGNFTLASGKKATYYLDGKQVTLDRHGARLIAEGILDLLESQGLPTAVGGMSIGADPITAAVVTMSAVRCTPLAGFMVRKESKGHGTNQYIEGPVQPGDEAVIVEDVVTTGGSSLLAIERCLGLRPEDSRRDRHRRPHGRGGRGVRRPGATSFASLLTIRDFGIQPPQG